jgi:hypothetical protein
MYFTVWHTIKSCHNANLIIHIAKDKVR